jgi:hypothetical protein
MLHACIKHLIWRGILTIFLGTKYGLKKVGWSSFLFLTPVVNWLKTGLDATAATLWQLARQVMCMWKFASCWAFFYPFCWSDNDFLGFSFARSLDRRGTFMPFNWAFSVCVRVWVCGSGSVTSQQVDILSWTNITAVFRSRKGWPESALHATVFLSEHCSAFCF